MDQHPDAQAPMRAALDATDKAARAIAMELNYWLGMTPSMNIPTSLLILVDAWREAEAQMFQFLPSDGITHEQTERAWKHAVEQAEALTAEPASSLVVCAVCGADGSSYIKNRWYCWQHGPADLPAGPTQDQEPCNICGFTIEECGGCEDEEEESPERSGELDPIVMGPISPYTHDRLPWE